MFILFCKESADIWSLVGKILFVFKIVIPLLLIIFGMIDLGKAVISAEEKAIKNATNSIIRRLIAAVVIFFVPTIIGAIFGLISDFDEQKKDYDLCKSCLVHPYDKDGCTKKADLACTKVGQTYYGADGEGIVIKKEDQGQGLGKKQYCSECPKAKECQ
ncbi:MAG: hypothetical protein J5634_00945 [Bacilli bacterium]|nr:hypothetical protein [Bacilli bacterium]